MHEVRSRVYFLAVLVLFSLLLHSGSLTLSLMIFVCIVELAEFVISSLFIIVSSGGLTMRPRRHVPPAPISGPKNRPRISTQLKYLRSLIFIIALFGH